MKKLFFILAALLAALGLAACASNNAVDGAHNSRNSLNWEGRYSGLVPGADSGIQTELTLNSDETFTLTTVYIDKSTEVFTETGTFTWSKDGGTIKLSIKNGPSQYIVGENQLIQLDLKGKRITGNLADMYILKKVN